MPWLLPLLTLWREFKILSLLGFLIVLYLVNKLFNQDDKKK